LERSREQSYRGWVGSNWTGEKVSNASPNKTAVLVVEDDFLIRMDAIDMVRDLGFEAIEAVDADHAFSFLERYPSLLISVVFTDIQMPGSMDGLRLAAVIRLRWPPVALLLTSGQVHPPAQELPSGARFLPKPYLAHQLKSHLEVLTRVTS
jgi:CheY-like chemotaxis protein